MNASLPIRLFAHLFLLFEAAQPTGRFGRRTTLIDASAQRAETQPPSLRQQADAGAGPWQRLLGWLLAPGAQAASPAPHRLPAVRADFASTLCDVDSSEAARLRDRIAQTRSLRELWHLRAEVYRVVAVAHSQMLAEQRLDQLNRHFFTRSATRSTTRSPKSQFATLL